MVLVTNESRRALLADFLRTRRARLSPSQIGLPAGGRRRTPGLRREEVAQAAGVSVAYYTWLEQARDLHVSRSVLESVANALQLSADERLHLFQLADHLYAPDPGERQEKLDPLLQRLLDSQRVNPALITGPACDILAWNRAACAVFGDFSALPEHERNILWLSFTESTFRQRLVGWENYAQEALAVFRAKSRHVVDDPDVIRLVDELERVSPEFRLWWPQHNVRTVTAPYQEVKHPQAGCLIFDHLSFQASAYPNLRVCIWLPDPASDTTEKLEELLKREDAEVR
ncbi:MAG: helix-turn-helix domain-containing protein [Chloroflexi bacterium]|nr:helix-turn-helix domain-containing protein [Chloroflexota bacterium]